jgi:hypothetical protein
MSITATRPEDLLGAAPTGRRRRRRKYARKAKKIERKLERKLEKAARKLPVDTPIDEHRRRRTGKRSALAVFSLGAVAFGVLAARRRQSAPIDTAPDAFGAAVDTSMAARGDGRLVSR